VQYHCLDPISGNFVVVLKFFGALLHHCRTFVQKLYRLLDVTPSSSGNSWAGWSIFFKRCYQSIRLQSIPILCFSWFYMCIFYGLHHMSVRTVFPRFYTFLIFAPFSGDHHKIQNCGFLNLTSQSRRPLTYPRLRAFNFLSRRLLCLKCVIRC